MHNLLGGIFVIALLIPVGLGLFANGVTVDKICGSNGNSGNSILFSDNFENGLNKWADWGTTTAPSNVITTTLSSISPTHSLTNDSSASGFDIWNNDTTFAVDNDFSFSIYLKNATAPTLYLENHDGAYTNTVNLEFTSINATYGNYFTDGSVGGISFNSQLFGANPTNWHKLTATVSNNGATVKFYLDDILKDTISTGSQFTQVMDKVELYEGVAMPRIGYFDNALVNTSHSGGGQNPHCVEALNVALLTPLIAVGGIIVLLIKRYNND